MCRFLSYGNCRELLEVRSTLVPLQLLVLPPVQIFSLKQNFLSFTAEVGLIA